MRNTEIFISSDNLSINFKTEDGKLVLNKLGSPNYINWISESGCRTFWSITLRSVDGRSIILQSNEIDIDKIKSRTNIKEFIWKALIDNKPSNIAMKISLDENDSISYWTLEMEVPDSWEVIRTDFPMIGNINKNRNTKMAVPWGWGLEFDSKSGIAFEGTYPSCAAAMQFISFYISGKGLYIGTHDKAGNHKHFSVNSNENQIDYRCINWPAIPKNRQRTFKIPYKAAIGVFNGDYYAAAQIYKDFTFSTPWGKGGSVSKRSIPKWLKETELWLMPAADPISNAVSCEKAKNFFDVPIVLHWYNWHQIPFDTLYPDYFPYKDNFPEGVSKLQELGLRVMPYINGRLSDADSRTWKEKDLINSAAKQEDGSIYTEIYGSKVELHPICPSTGTWQETVSELVSKLTDECGVDGVYIDQIGAAGAVRCFDPNHEHDAGGGNMWVKSYRDMLANIRKTLPRDKMLTTEENAECWIDQLDALLLVNTPTSNAKIIPLFPSVYSGRTITFGFQYIMADDIQKSFPLRVKMARAFVWGSQLGWISVDSVSDPESLDAQFLRNMARCRRFGHEYLVYGTFLGMVDRIEPIENINGKASSSFGPEMYDLDLPAVLASSWLGEDGSLGLVVVNMSDNEQYPKINLPIDKIDISADESFKMRIYGSEGKIKSIDTTEPIQKFTLQPRSAMIISVSK